MSANLPLVPMGKGDRWSSARILALWTSKKSLILQRFAPQLLDRLGHSKFIYWMDYNGIYTSGVLF